MGRWFFAAVAATAGLIAGVAQAAEAGAPRVGQFALSRIVQKLPAGKEWAIFQVGVFCAGQEKSKSDGVQTPISVGLYGSVFIKEFTDAGFGQAGPINLFAESAARLDPPAYEVGALVHDMDLKFCFAPGSYLGRAKGEGAVKIQWQIYSPAKKLVVATIETVGAASLKWTWTNSPANFPPQLLRDAFADALHKLTISPELKAVVDASPREDATLSTPGQQTKLHAIGGSSPRPVGDTIGSVVLVALPGGHGSGVLVSEDGYVLTNAHVVGPNRSVQVRWSDGYETAGQVVRIHAARDVALVKTDPHGRQPVPLGVGALQPGDAVLAIGAPLDENLQGTVSKGVVSANRIIDGYSFIQSDVMVNHGNSGGALIDEKGYLVGLTDIGRVDAAGSPVGLNFFIPIKDALDFLSLELTPAKPVTQAVQAPAVSFQR